MCRLIEIDDAIARKSAITVVVGDLLVFAASGGRADTSSNALRLLGPFVRALIGTNGTVVEPMGPPNAVVFVAQAAGIATIDLINGDPFGTSTTTTLTVTVEARSA